MEMNQLTSIERKLDKVIEVQNEHTEQIDFLAEKSLEHENGIEKMVRRMNDFDLRMDSFELRMDNFERRTEENFAAVRNEAQSNFDAIITILRRLDEDRFATHTRLLRLEQHVGLS